MTRDIWRMIYAHIYICYMIYDVGLRPPDPPPMGWGVQAGLYHISYVYIYILYIYTIYHFPMDISPPHPTGGGLKHLFSWTSRPIPFGGGQAGLYHICYVIDDIYIYIFIFIYVLWYMISEIWHMTYDIWYMPYDIWHMIFAIWYLIYDIPFMKYDSSHREHIRKQNYTIGWL